MECCVEVSATAIPREGRTPLLAVEVTDGNGGMLDLQLIDADEVDAPAGSWPS